MESFGKGAENLTRVHIRKWFVFSIEHFLKWLPAIVGGRQQFCSE
jgi:hypothetical protein